MYCVGGSLKNVCHFEMGRGVWQMLTSSGGRLKQTVADRGKGGGGKICQNLADVIFERSLSIPKFIIYYFFVEKGENSWEYRVLDFGPSCWTRLLS